MQSTSSKLVTILLAVTLVVNSGFSAKAATSYKAGGHFSFWGPEDTQQALTPVQVGQSSGKISYSAKAGTSTLDCSVTGQGSGIAGPMASATCSGSIVISNPAALVAKLAPGLASARLSLPTSVSYELTTLKTPGLAQQAVASCTFEAGVGSAWIRGTAQDTNDVHQHTTTADGALGALALPSGSQNGVGVVDVPLIVPADGNQAISLNFYVFAEAGSWDLSNQAAANAKIQVTFGTSVKDAQGNPLDAAALGIYVLTDAPDTPPPGFIPTILITTDQTTYHISAKPEMPVIHASAVVTNPPENPMVRWKSRITFDPSKYPHGPKRTDLNLDGPDVVLPLGQPYIPPFASFRGGDLSISASLEGVSGLSASTEGLTIIADNPTPEQVTAATPQEYRGVLDLIGHHESGHRQFAAGYPLWSQDNLHGVGWFQITDPQPTSDQVWDWTENLRGAVKKIRDNAKLADRYRRGLTKSGDYQMRVLVYNRKREARGLAPLKITPAPFTSGSYNGPYQQRERICIRAFNGAAGQDPFSNQHLQEYRLVSKPRPKREGELKIDFNQMVIDEPSSTGTIPWEVVPAADRPPKVGDPDYVHHVLGSLY